MLMIFRGRHMDEYSQHEFIFILPKINITLNYNNASQPVSLNKIKNRKMSHKTLVLLQN